MLSIGLNCFAMNQKQHIKDPLLRAISKRRYDDARKLIPQSTNINVQDENGDTPLHLVERAIAGGAHGCDVMIRMAEAAKTDPGMAWYYFDQEEFAETKHRIQEAHEIMKALLDAKANPNIQNKLGATPLLHLARWSKPGIAISIELLLQYGANPNIKDCFEKTALDYLSKEPEFESPEFASVRKKLEAAMPAKEQPKPQFAKPQPSKTQTFYTILGIERNASQAKIKSAFRNLALQYHPDKAAQFGLTSEQAQQKFIELKDAFDTLSDPRRRADYDQTLR